jgi:MFS transporter, NNP family, nitrate/nitrite transporter
MVGNFLSSENKFNLFTAFLYFTTSFMVRVILVRPAVEIAFDLHLGAGEQGLMVAVPMLAGAAIRIVSGVAVDYLKPKLSSAIGQILVIIGLAAAWYFGIHSLHQVLLLGGVLGIAGASFAVALPLGALWDAVLFGQAVASDLAERVAETDSMPPPWPAAPARVPDARILDVRILDARVLERATR